MRRAERGVEDRGSRIEEPHQVLHSLDPRSSIPDPVLIQRVRWRSRRGLLELDIVLGRFIEKYYAGLDQTERQAFEEMLDMPDNPLWDMIAGRLEATHAEQQALLDKIRAA
ncbi:MAG: succinate dehydrogenase assembly factor 2 [Pseudomonadota bacterium]